MSRALRVILLGIAIIIAIIVAIMLWPTSSRAEEQELPSTLEIVAAREWVEDSWDMDEAVERARDEETAGRESVWHRPEVGESLEERLLDAALRLQPGLKRQPERARRVVGAIFEVAVEESFDPFLLLAYASRESGFRANARGALGEQGLLQLHGYARRVCAKGLDLGQPRSNLRAGICWLRAAQRKCETTNVWITTAAYGTGKCLDLDVAKRLDCTKRKRAELIKAVGEDRARMIWPE